MKRFQFLNSVVLRIPRYCKELMECPQHELLKDPVFRDAIYLASETIYHELLKRNFDMDLCSLKLRQTLMKYHRRMCCRPTPFGAFSSVAVTRWNTISQSEIVVCQESFNTILHTNSINAQQVGGYYLNPSLYHFGKNYRLYDGTQKDERGTRIFNLSEIERKGIPVELLNKKGLLSGSDIFKLLADYGLSGTQAEIYLNELFDSQILLKHEHPAGHSFAELPAEEMRGGKGTGLYAYTHHKTKGFIDCRIQETLLDGIWCLNKLSPVPQQSDLEKFKLKFYDLFDRREIPLLLALDPEAGIDYGGNAVWNEEESISLKPETGRKPHEWSKVHELLLRKWTGQQNAGLPVITIEKEDLLALEEDKELKPPPGQMVLFSIADDQVHIHAAGGASAVAMIGRFTIFDNEILSVARQICAIEQETNPEVIFAELIHDSEEDTDKLNQRAHFRDYVIPVLTNSDAAPEHHIGLNDLFLSIVDGNLVLRSKRLNKRIIPGLGTAYNYRRNPLSIYRLLCDLQYEGIQPGSNFSMAKLFPGLPFYPRVCYQHVILEAASWHLGSDIFKHLYSQQTSFLPEFLNFAGDLGLPDVFIYEQNDQRLLIRKNNSDDVWLLIQAVRNQKLIILREYIAEEKALVKGDGGGSYAHELIAFLVSKEKTYTGVPVKPQNNSRKISRFYPLDEWHFLKVYMHPCGMNRFLTKALQTFLNTCSKNDLIEKWYFIRYNDGDDHLRIRFKPAKNKNPDFIKRLQMFIAGLKKGPFIHQVQLSTYERELERYYPIGIHHAEYLFYLSSELALKTIRSNSYPGIAGSQAAYQVSSQTRELINGIKHIFTVFRAANFSHSQMTGFSQQAYSGLFNRLNLNKELKIQYDQEYRKLSPHLEVILKTHGSFAAGSYFPELAKKIRLIKKDDRLQVLADLNHMHLNRIFTTGQPFMEAQCYFYLYKYLLQEAFRTAPACAR